ncbi:hypothetical protein [Methylovulum psychrotolerans]|uniref:Uncharacterized protein n=1 Tax=Methylovulum psychrotolerans TaxID=1704499 RepID=A0A2S5CIL8_9GAMM|nr:hypothetical protein [Methylovulum psychrotolerans]POZ50651.1 hypothetical protein AADEFJLK_03546 [Methylovulum psychrotolerans]
MDKENQNGIPDDTFLIEQVMERVKIALPPQFINAFDQFFPDFVIPDCELSDALSCIDPVPSESPLVGTAIPSGDSDSVCKQEDCKNPYRTGKPGSWLVPTDENCKNPLCLLCDGLVDVLRCNYERSFS